MLEISFATDGKVQTLFDTAQDIVEAVTKMRGKLQTRPDVTRFHVFDPQTGKTEHFDLAKLKNARGE